MNEWIDGGLMGIEYMNECWADIRMEGCCLGIG